MYGVSHEIGMSRTYQSSGRSQKKRKKRKKEKKEKKRAAEDKVKWNNKVYLSMTALFR